MCALLLLDFCYFLCYFPGVSSPSVVWTKLVAVVVGLSVEVLVMVVVVLDGLQLRPASVDTVLVEVVGLLLVWVVAVVGVVLVALISVLLGVGAFVLMASVLLRVTTLGVPLPSLSIICRVSPGLTFGVWWIVD